MFVPQLLEKTQQNLEFPKYHIVNTPRQFRTLLESRDETTRVCATPLISISSGISVQFRQANFENI
jgi:hypothetical protein